MNDTEAIYRAALAFGTYKGIESRKHEDLIPAMAQDIRALAAEYGVTIPEPDPEPMRNVSTLEHYREWLKCAPRERLEEFVALCAYGLYYENEDCKLDLESDWGSAADYMESVHAYFGEMRPVACELHKCQNCEKEWHEDGLKDIRHLEQRVAAGEPMPSGECPECGCLCHALEESAL